LHKPFDPARLTMRTVDDRVGNVENQGPELVKVDTEKFRAMSGMWGARASNGKRALQVAVAVCSLVPIAAGAGGMLLGPAFLGNSVADFPDLDSHFRYLSGLLLGIGLAYAFGVPGIERRRERFLLLGGIVVLGGLGRLSSLLSRGAPSPIMISALVMELLVTPILTLWQMRVAR
jgi:hypothetical protein